MNYEVEFYTKLKTVINKEVPEIKHIRIFNNQFERYSEENSWTYPCLFVQFTPIEHSQLLRGIQNIEYTITLHVGLESYLDEDLRIYELKQKVYKTAQYFDCANWSKLERTAERPDFNHDAYQVYQLDFRTILTDYTDDNRPKTPATLIPTVELEIKSPDELE